tara:strand:- start:2655 stop:2894 length:240 start_codon:yes stop_codon:yes gene_type:complete
MDEEPLLENKFVADTLDQNDIDNDPILKENKRYSEQYNELRKQEGNQQDAVQLHTRSWLQTVNMGIACIILGVLIYKQK